VVQNQPPAPAWLAKSQEQSAHGNEGWNTGRLATVDKPAKYEHLMKEIQITYGRNSKNYLNYKDMGGGWASDPC